MIFLSIIIQGVNNDIIGCEAFRFISETDKLLGKRVYLWVCTEGLSGTPEWVCEKLPGPEDEIGICRRGYCCADAWVVREGAAVQAEEPPVRFALQLEAFGFDIFDLHIDGSIVKTKSTNITITFDRWVAWREREERVYHHAIECTIDLFGYLTKDDQVGYLALKTAWDATLHRVQAMRPCGR
ncbi:hypothetical protein HG530_014874 [Fusarium avenaceum]|nr:hypothetical protein HG530_014874 [Fusarium avenaceum]